MEEASVIFTGLNIERVMQGLEIISSQRRNKYRSLDLVNDYSQNNVSKKIVRIIISYVDYVKNFVWKENP